MRGRGCSRLLKQPVTRLYCRAFPIATLGLRGRAILEIARHIPSHDFTVLAAITEQEIGFEWVSADAVEGAVDRVGFLLVAADVGECQRHWFAV